MQEEQFPRVQYQNEQSLFLEAPFWINEGVLLEELNMQLPQGHSRQEHRNPKRLRNDLHHLRCRFDRRYLTALIGRTLSGGGLSDLQIRTHQARVEISGLLSREGRRTPFLARGFLYESAGPYGGAIFYDLRLFGRPGLPAPALISLLTARTGRHGPIHVRGAVTLQFDLLSLLCKWGLAAAGWKIPNYKQIQLRQLEVIDDSISLLYNAQNTHAALPLAQRDPAYPYWIELSQSEQTFLKAEELIGNGDYKAALQAYSDELWRNPGHPFLQERLMQLYIASPQQEMWAKAYHIAEELLQRTRQSQAALNCLAQYFEGVQDYQTAAHYYTKLGENARINHEHVEAALSFGKAAELLETMDTSRARSLWQMAREEDRAYRPAIAALARHALKIGEYKEAEEILRDLIEQTPPSIERARYHLSLAGLYRSRLRDLTNARQQLDLAAPYLGEDIAFLRELAEFRLATDENIDALRILDRLSERVKLLNQPALYSDLLFRSGQILEERLGKPGPSLFRYREALRLRPEHPHAPARILALESAGIVEETMAKGAFDDLDLLIEEKLRTIETGQYAPAEAARLHLELARLYWQQEQIDDAFSQAQTAIQLQSQLEEAWELLEEIGLQSGRQQELSELHRNLAKNALFPLDAVQHLEKALRLDPDDTTTLQQLSLQYRKMKLWDKLDILYSRWIEVASSSHIPQLWLQKAELQEQERNDLDSAERSFVQSFQTAEDRTPYQQAMIAFYVRQQRWDKLERQLLHLAQSLTPIEEAALHAEKARQFLAAERPLAMALEAYQKALKLDPENTYYLTPTIDLLRQESDWQALAPLLKRIADATQEPSEELAFRLELAEIYETKIDQPKQAREEYKRATLLDNHHKAALTQLASLSVEQQAYDDAIQAFEQLLPILSTTGDVAAQTHTTEQLLLLYSRLAQNQKIDPSLTQLLTLQPSYGDDQQTKLFAGAALPQRKARALIALGQQHKQTGLIRDAIQYLSEEYPDDANVALKAGLAIAPLDPHLWLYRITQTPEDQRLHLWDLFERNIKTNLDPAQPQQRDEINALFELLRDQETLSLGEAKDLYKLFSDKHITILHLSRLYASMLERDDQLAEALKVREELVESLPPGEEKTNLRFEMAIQQLHVLNDRDNGLRHMWALLQEQPEHADAFYELQQIYEEGDQLNEFVDKLEELTTHAAPGAGRADLCIRVFEFHRDLLAQPDKADAFLELASQTKSDVDTLQAIAAMYEASEQFTKAAELYERISQQDNVEASLIALERAGEIYQRELDEPDRAIDFFLQIIALDPSHQVAADELKTIYESLWMWQEYAGLLELQANHIKETDKAQASELFYQMGDIYLGRLQEYDKALELYRRSLRNNPRNVKVLSGLHALYEEQEDWPAVLSAIKAIIRNEPVPERLVDLHMQIASIQLDRLDQPDEAEKHYKLAHEQETSNPAPLSQLLSLYEGSERLEDIARTAAELAIFRIKRKEDGKEALRRMFQAASRIPGSQGAEGILRDILQERQESAKLTRQIFDVLNEISSTGTLSPTFYLAQQLYTLKLIELSWMLRLWDSEGELLSEEQADEILDAAQAQDWAQLHKTLLQLTKDTSNTEEKASFHLALAELALHLRQHAEDAEHHAKEALSLGAPPERAMLIFEALQEQTHGELQLESLLTIAKELTHPDELSRVLFHLGSIFLLSQNDWTSCLQCFLEASLLTPNAPAVGASVKLIRQSRKTHAALQTLPEGLTPLNHALVQAWMGFSTDQITSGIAALETTLQHEPNCSAALRLLGHYYYKVQPDDALASKYFHQFLELEWEHLPFDEVVEACLQLSQVYAQQSNFDNSLFYLEQAEKFIPEDPRIFSSQTQVLKMAGFWEELKLLYENHIESPEPTDNLAELWYHLGQLHEVHLQNPEEAQLCYQRALQIDPLHTPSLQALEALNQIVDNNALSGL